MRFSKIILICLFVMSCSSAHLVDFWKNPDIDSYNPNKVLIIGITTNNFARQKFEQKLKEEFNLRGIEAIPSLDFFDPSLETETKTEEQLSTLENSLLENGFDTILLTKIIGIENKVAYSRNYDSNEETFRKFSEDYYMHQDIYNDPDYYERYTVYNAETSMYCICPTKERELIWKGSIDIIDPQSIDETVNDYIKLMTLVLEEQQLIKSIDQYKEEQKAAIQ